ncbi:MAG: hypothetical protein A2Z25_00415 [Planctomycetes bacterium RBG_16_55_9]|nr:MAG: hypothetical protein A2Z25_00415 [Planctomycetes bacterium RBG_16_55_9]
MFTKLDSEVMTLLCCPLCKSSLSHKTDAFTCDNCSTTYSPKTFSVGDHEESIFDFRLNYPKYCVPLIMKRWSELQDLFENTQRLYRKRDTLERYLGEIDAVQEVYNDEFHMKGRILDVGGHVGRIRHFLGDDTTLYVSIDPFWNTFQDIQKKQNLLQAYPCIEKACNFLAAHAEHLPFAANSFDWVHMRSVVDHFIDPYLAFKEAYRVLHPDGYLLIGLILTEKLTPKHAKKRRNIIARGIKKLKKGKSYSFWKDSKIYGGPDDDHMFRFKHTELMDLMSMTGFELDKEHWQKEPFSFCINVTGRKK